MTFFANVVVANLLNVLSFSGAVLVDVLVESLTNNVEPKSVFIWLSEVLVNCDVVELVETVEPLLLSDVEFDAVILFDSVEFFLFDYLLYLLT